MHHLHHIIGKHRLEIGATATKHVFNTLAMAATHIRKQNFTVTSNGLHLNYTKNLKKKVLVCLYSKQLKFDLNLRINLVNS